MLNNSRSVRHFGAHAKHLPLSLHSAARELFLMAEKALGTWDWCQICHVPQQKLPPLKQRHVAPQKRTPSESNLWTRKIFGGQGAMRFWQLTCFAAAFAASPLCVTVVAKIPTGQSNLAAEVGVTEQPPSFFILSATPATFSQRFSCCCKKRNLSSITPTRRKLG